MISDKAFRRIAQELGDEAEVYVEWNPMIDLEDLFSWHGGQGDPIYAVASSWHSGKEVPASLVESAITNLERSYSQLKLELDKLGYDENQWEDYKKTYNEYDEYEDEDEGEFYNKVKDFDKLAELIYMMNYTVDSAKKGVEPV